MVKMGLEKGYKKRLNVSEKTFDKVTNHCVKEFLKHHPEMRGLNITHNLIVNQLADFYLKN